MNRLGVLIAVVAGLVFTSGCQHLTKASHDTVDYAVDKTAEATTAVTDTAGDVIERGVTILEGDEIGADAVVRDGTDAVSGAIETSRGFISSEVVGGSRGVFSEIEDFFDFQEYRVSQLNNELLSRNINSLRPNHKTGSRDLSGQLYDIRFGKTLGEADLGTKVRFDAAFGPTFLYATNGEGVSSDDYGFGAGLDLRATFTELPLGGIQPFVGVDGGYMYTHHRWDGASKHHTGFITPNIGAMVPLSLLGCDQDEDGEERGFIYARYGMMHISDLGGPSRFGDNDGWNTDQFTIGLQFDF